MLFLELARNDKNSETVYIRKEEDSEFSTKEKSSNDAFDVFIDNRTKQHIVVMGIEGNVDTTEVGIFFSQGANGEVSLEVSSLSSSAKRRVAEAVFKALDLRFSS